MWGTRAWSRQTFNYWFICACTWLWLWRCLISSAAISYVCPMLYTHKSTVETSLISCLCSSLCRLCFQCSVQSSTMLSMHFNGHDVSNIREHRRVWDHKDGNLNFFTEELFEADLPIADRAKHWIAVFSNFGENDGKVLEHTLLQKRRWLAVKKSLSSFVYYVIYGWFSRLPGRMILYVWIFQF
jgi:hypothetical protein